MYETVASRYTQVDTPTCRPIDLWMTHIDAAFLVTI